MKLSFLSKVIFSVCCASSFAMADISESLAAGDVKADLYCKSHKLNATFADGKFEYEFFGWAYGYGEGAYSVSEDASGELRVQIQYSAIDGESSNLQTEALLKKSAGGPDQYNLNFVNGMSFPCRLVKN